MSWHSPKAMAVYTIAGVVIGTLGLLFGNNLWKHVFRATAPAPAVEVEASASAPAVEVKAPASASRSEGREAVGNPRAVKVESRRRERVIVGNTLSELRLRNNVRPLKHEEQSMEDLSRLSGIYGFARARIFEKNLDRNRDLLSAA